MTSLKVPGNQVMITELMHSPVMTRFFGDQLEGWCGNTAVVRLDGARAIGHREYVVGQSLWMT
ncbi:hypothetical protein AB0H88_19800 [Nonomuraea sp. NPDC050680]|uniref:hypothetical protein n=1 Tax=Nonomuraea sp. NPDC050680 TaxID=3154630 RepID=UPI0033F4D905